MHSLLSMSDFKPQKDFKPTTDTITRSFPWTTHLSDIADIIEHGVQYVPFAGNLITPEMAELRKARNRSHPGSWSKQACRIQYLVEFRRADSLAVAALGRAGR